MKSIIKKCFSFFFSMERKPARMPKEKQKTANNRGKDFENKAIENSEILSTEIYYYPHLFI